MCRRIESPPTSASSRDVREAERPVIVLCRGVLQRWPGRAMRYAVNAGDYRHVRSGGGSDLEHQPPSVELADVEPGKVGDLKGPVAGGGLADERRQRPSVRRRVGAHEVVRAAT